MADKANEKAKSKPKDKAAAKGKAEGKGKGKGKGQDKGGDDGAPKGAHEKPRLQVFYEKEVVPSLQKQFGITNGLRVPRLEKITVNMGAGDALQNIKLLDGAMEDLSLIVGQRPTIRRAKKSISNFKLREGVPVGCAVTLRRSRMWEFFDRLLNVAVPRIRDFRGFSQKSFDGRGNYSIGLKEQIVFPEIDYDKVAKIRGMDITFVTSAQNDDEGRELLRLLKWPFRER